MEGISQNTTTACSGRLYQKQSDSTLIIGDIDCADGINIGSQVATQQVNCRNDQQVAATARAAATQQATANVSGLLPMGSSSASNFVDMQSAIAQTIQSRCDASIVQSIQGETYQISTITATEGVCNVLAQVADQKFACVNSVAASATISQSVSQTATATVSGIDTDMLFMIFLIVAVVFCGGPLLAVLGAPFEILETIVNIVGDIVRAAINLVSRAGTVVLRLADKAETAAIGKEGT